MRACVRARVCVLCVFDSQLPVQITYFGQLLSYAHKRIADIMKVYIETNNMHVELIRFRNKCRLYSYLRSEEFNATNVFTLRKSLQHNHAR